MPACTKYLVCFSFVALHVRARNAARQIEAEDAQLTGSGTYDEFFQGMDTNKDQLLTMDEIQTRLNQDAVGTSEDDMGLYLHFPTADVDGDGSISKDEAVTFFTLFDGDDDVAEGDDEDYGQYVSDSRLLVVNDEDDAEGAENDDSDGGVADVLHADEAELFATIDADSNELLTIDEIVTASRQQVKGLNEDVIKEYFAKIDIDGDGSISKNEATAIFCLLNVEYDDGEAHNADYVEDDFNAVFIDIDTDNNELLTQDEVLVAGRLAAIDIEEEDIMKYFFEADIDRDGVVSKDEASNLYSRFIMDGRDAQDEDAEDLASAADAFFDDMDTNGNQRKL